jgi:hypothetical protein
MKFTKLLLATLAVAGLTACSDDNDQNYSTVTYSFEFTDTSSLYNEDGYWADVYNEEATACYVSPALALSHTANAVWQSWTGFCPSQANETADVSAESILTHQWSSVTGNGAGNSTQYMVCFWSSSGEDLDNIPETPSLKMVLDASGTATSVLPQTVYVANTNYAYWVMKNGCSCNKVFGTDDWFKIIFKGVKNNQVTGTAECYLAKDGEISKTWNAVDLTTLGDVDYIYIQLDSSDKTSYDGGKTYYMNNPSYVCLDNLVVTYNY